MMETLKIALLGYGKMGKEIEKIAIAKKHEIVAVIDQQSDWKQWEQQVLQADVAIDFSMPEFAKENIYKCFELGVPVVVGTTGWYDELEEVIRVCNDKKASLLWAGNFSIGMNIFFKVNSYLAELMTKFPEYKAHIHEIHHDQKLDAPSGTAIAIAKGIIDNHEALNNWVLTENLSGDDAGILPISYERIGKVPGTHQVYYSSDIDIISLHHEAKNRKGFASGAVLAAEWLMGKQGVFTMNDVMA